MGDGVERKILLGDSKLDHLSQTAPPSEAATAAVRREPSQSTNSVSCFRRTLVGTTRAVIGRRRRRSCTHITVAAREQRKRMSMA